MTDLEIVKAYLAGLPGAKDALGVRLACVAGLVRQRSLELARPLDRETQEELSQDVLMVMLQVLPRYTGQSSLRSWAKGFVARRVLKHFEQLGAWQQILRRLGEEPAPTSPREPDPLEDLAVRQALSEIDPKERETLFLRFNEDMSFVAIAEHFEEPTSTTKSRFSRAMEKIKRRLGEG